MIKYQIRFFFEYGGWCLWGADMRTQEIYGYPIEPETLPLTKATINQIQILTARFQTSLNWEDPASGSPWSKDELAAFQIDSGNLYNRIKEDLSEEFEIYCEQIW